MKIHYAAVTDAGRKQRADSRDEIDRWASDRCAEGQQVTVYSRESRGGEYAAPVRVGEWRPV